MNVKDRKNQSRKVVKSSSSFFRSLVNQQTEGDLNDENYHVKNVDGMPVKKKTSFAIDNEIIRVDEDENDLNDKSTKKQRSRSSDHDVYNPLFYSSYLLPLHNINTVLGIRKSGLTFRRLLGYVFIVIWLIRRVYIRNFVPDPDFKIISNYMQNLNTVSTDNQHNHVIPNIISFTYKLDLLKADVNELTESERFLKENIERTIALHPSATVHFLTDEKCLESIKSVLNDYGDTLQKLDEYFVQEPQGMYKADICRGAALLQTGGLYFDIDLRVRFGVWNVIPSMTEFVVPQVYKEHRIPGSFFQAFIGSTKGHPILLKYLQNFVEHYQGIKRLPKTHWGFVEPPLGVVFLRQAYDEVPGESKRNVVLWKETKYNPKIFKNVEKPTGIHRVCHYVVGIPHTSIVPFYSRIPGSRMCKHDVNLWDIFAAVKGYFKFTFLL